MLEVFISSPVPASRSNGLRNCFSFLGKYPSGASPFPIFTPPIIFSIRGIRSLPFLISDALVPATFTLSILCFLAHALTSAEFFGLINTGLPCFLASLMVPPVPSPFVFPNMIVPSEFMTLSLILST